MNMRGNFSFCVIIGMMSTYCETIEKENEMLCPDREGDGDAHRGILGAPVKILIEIFDFSFSHQLLFPQNRWGT